jgi:hypothetical protein
MLGGESERADVRSADDLREIIEQRRSQIDEQKEREDRAIEEEAAAEERQRLRRVLEELDENLTEVQDDAENQELRNRWIDEDKTGDFVASSNGGGRLHSRTRSPPKKAVVQSGCSTLLNAHIVKKEYEWKITGMSWLHTSLEQAGDTCAASKAFKTSLTDDGSYGSYGEYDQKFALLYNPYGEYLKLGPVLESRNFYPSAWVQKDAGGARGSLALTCSDPSITMRVRFIFAFFLFSPAHRTSCSCILLIACLLH